MMPSSCFAWSRRVSLRMVEAGHVCKMQTAVLCPNTGQGNRRSRTSETIAMRHLIDADMYTVMYSLYIYIYTPSMCKCIPTRAGGEGLGRHKSRNFLQHRRLFGERVTWNPPDGPPFRGSFVPRTRRLDSMLVMGVYCFSVEISQTKRGVCNQFKHAGNYWAWPKNNCAPGIPSRKAERGICVHASFCSVLP